ncbi:MAG: PilZ domain-containing protein [Candidatus Thiodiazotropha sp. (ex Dulcina madagascariensis)]|nr:PilZ domain-containing protein [Candidatus Thiodiazotropha sp. (ex Epidulcina cf. delphinae)]MCU7922595.1 PilZ domain-containing protein [Candidatus Thiodiazotropha sp. (ex Dulcina madagascariensis)]MCU7926392.1 PilZ domain-containing protein [Candidatus Thiodiazotropha sp. (ex Dulcina madagascariensis)]MCU7935768.1 PilZ domain-containing protein [Candidatus Thiodiazotropha sp. (ex Dulcina madagascariensis)]
MSTSQTDERRRFHRILFDAPATIESNHLAYQTTLLDISLKGALARTPADWNTQVGEKITLRVRLDDADRVITMQAVCAHIEAGCIGVLCEEIDMASISLLRRLVELNIGDEAVLQRDLEALG